MIGTVNPRRFRLRCGILAWGMMLAGFILADRALGAGDGVAGSPPRLEACETWTPHPDATPVSRRLAEGVALGGNGTRTCCGGWQFVFSGVRPGQAYRIRARAEHQGVAVPRDSLVALALWDRWPANKGGLGTRPWNYLLPHPASGGRMEFENILRAPDDATTLTVRYTFRWSPRGRSQWSLPQIEPVNMPPRKPVKVCIINATARTTRRIAVQPLSAGLGLSKEMAAEVDLWGSLALAACKRKPHLIVTPEVVIRGKGSEEATAVPGPATRPFEKIAREHGVYIVVGMYQRDGDAMYNTAVLIGPPGRVLGVYRKVHLAVSEGLSAVSPGEGFPVFETPIGRIGCLICMDTTVSESVRMLALGGADFICFPIMGDLRADRWSPGSPVYSEDRWKAIMRTRAIDNQVCMVVARNSVQGSCIINRKGDILAWNEGDREIIEATLPAEDGFRTWDGGDFRETTILLRRPHLYGAYTDGSDLKSLRTATH